MPDSSLLQRLKERKLVQWALAYLAGAFVVFQLLDALDEALGLSTGTHQAILALVVVGFFITLILAWYHGEKGRQRVSGPELLMVAALLVVAGVALSMLRGGEEGREPAKTAPITTVVDDRPSIAVLPFDNFSPSPDDAHFADGMQDEIISKLAKISAIKVISRSSVEQYREHRKPIPEIAAELGGVDFVLEGSARVAGDQVRLITQLIDAKEEGHIWSEEYDRSLTTENLFAVQIEVAEQIAGSMSVVISPEEQARIEARPTNDLEAYELYLIGRHRWTTRSAETMREAISYFEAAIERDSTFALAYSGVADALMVLPFYDLNAEPLDVYGDVKAAVTKALDLDPSLGEIHATVGMMALYYEWDWDAAEHHLQMALEVAPSYPSSHQFYSNLLEARGQYGEAVEELAVALSLDPMSNVLVWEMADALGSVGRTQEARTQFERAIHMEPLIPWALTDYADDLLEAEPVDSARAGELYAEFAAYFGYPHPERVATIVLAIGEGPGAVTDYLALLEDVAEKTVLDRTDLLWFYFPPVPPDVFFDVLEEAAELRHIWVPFTPTVVAQYGQELREDPRWERFLRQIQYPGSPE